MNPHRRYHAHEPHPPDPSDRLVWDSIGGLGWIDPSPEGFLPSIGVDRRETDDCLVYTIGRDGTERRLVLPKDSDWAVIRACLDDAERRARE